MTEILIDRSLLYKISDVLDGAGMSYENEGYGVLSDEAYDLRDRVDELLAQGEVDDE